MQRSTIPNVSDRKGVLSRAESPYDRLPAMLKPVLRGWTWTEGRGPELRRAHFRGRLVEPGCLGLPERGLGLEE
jgi:hypothetical protein